MAADATIYEDGTYLENNPGWHEEDSPWKAAQIARILRRNQVAPATVCEIGCGAGGVLAGLARELGEGVAFSGYDISRQAHELCQRRQAPNLRFFHRDLLAEEDARFDLVLCIDVFEHVEDCFGFLRRLRPRGALKVFHIPLDLSVQTVLRRHPILFNRASVGHIHYFFKETALATLADTGYEVVDWCYTNSSLELAHRGWKANLLRLPRRLAFALDRDLAVRLLGGWSLLVLAK
jgi:cyclopropane fatty-acyl-phospholipid synthase-like methyltransferase